jgi:NTE family protein
VLRAIGELLPSKAPNPFPVVTGTSAGAINATYVAIQAHRFRVAVGNLERVWRNFQVSQVFAADTGSMVRGSLHWLLALLSAGWLLPPPKSMFDNAPLRELLLDNFDFDEIAHSIEAGHLEAIAIAAAGYTSARSVAFYQSTPNFSPWMRVRRSGQPCKITIDHLMASVAVPFLFPPVLMGDEYYGDGSMRQATPFSSAIHLGASRLLVIPTRDGATLGPTLPQRAPSFGQIFGFMLDALFTDGLYSDYERLAQLNHIVDQSGPIQVDGARLRRVDLLVINPSRDISQIARSHVQSLPRTLRILLRTMGAMNASGGELMSYLMFQSSYTRELIALGYHDGMENAQRIMAFMRGERLESTGMTGVMKKLS